jgi:hypothetical protein
MYGGLMRWSRRRITKVRDHPSLSPQGTGEVLGSTFSICGMLSRLRRFHPRKGTSPEAPPVHRLIGAFGTACRNSPIYH